MIYRIFLTVAAAIAASTCVVFYKYHQDANEVALHLQESEQALAAAQAKETEAAGQLQQALQQFGRDATEATCAEWVKAAQAKKAEVEAMSNGVSELTNRIASEKLKLESILTRAQGVNEKLDDDIAKLREEITRQGGDPDNIPEELLNAVIPPLASEVIADVVAARLNFVHADKVTPEALSESFEDVIYRLGDDGSFSLQALSDMCRNEVNTFSHRGLKLKTLGIHPSAPMMQLVMAFVYKSTDKSNGAEDKKGYLLTTYQVDDDDKIIAISEYIYSTEPVLSEGIIPCPYNGPKTVTTSGEVRSANAEEQK